jgi:hypothetical protein
VLQVRWEAVFVTFGVCHLIGDFILQTDWQATNKRGGLSRNREARRALLSHVTVYTLVFVPAIVWIALNRSAWAVGLLAVIFIPHLILDDTRVVMAWNRWVKGSTPNPGEPLYLAVDQSFHMLFLFGAALLAVA